jgi:hypothetical protein
VCQTLTCAVRHVFVYISRVPSPYGSVSVSFPRRASFHNVENKVRSGGRWCFGRFLTYEMSHLTCCGWLLPQWVPEIRHHAPSTAFILVGTKADLRESPDWRVKYEADSVNPDEGAAMARKLGAVSYLECSALTQKGLKAIFDEAIRQGLQKKPERVKPTKDKKPICSIL